MANDKQELIDQFHKNSIELIEVNLNEWRSDLYVDIRIWTLEKPSEPGNVKPSHKGICLSAELLPKLIRALEKAEARIKAKSETGPESREGKEEGLQEGQTEAKTRSERS